MISNRCSLQNKGIIPKLLSQHGAVLSGDQAVIDLSTAENWFLKEKLLQTFANGADRLAISGADLSYAEGIGGDATTRRMLARLLNDQFNPANSVDPSHIVLAAGGSFALSALLGQICNPGDGVLIAAPYWPGLDICFTVHNEVTAVPVHVPLEDFFGASSIPRYEEALRSARVPVKAVFVCNPHNPLGQCYPKETLEVILDFCKHHNLHYISNEVYALSQHQIEVDVDGPPPFVSVLSLEPQSDIVHVLYSLSKDFGANGIRAGAVITVNDQIRLSCALSAHSQVSTMATWIATKLILREENVHRVVNEGQKDLKHAYTTIERFLTQRKLTFIPATCGQFVFVKLLASGERKDESNLSQVLSRNAVAVSSGASYHCNEAGWYRICYAVPRATLEEGLGRIEKSLAEYGVASK
ncbi:aminotransferase GliI [Massariosphaeria phaeospora]|uniref:Aminotransferase GliI n=1 Tax=Massariosphaeria phaeospora TaxID=100035 RepID=A0A7C8I6R3_9PLEO|nr:aminotransferase GliI [Massariosphaeria phaeospora]